MGFAEGRNQSKQEGAEIGLGAHIDQFSCTSAQQNPQGGLELPLNRLTLQCHYQIGPILNTHRNLTYPVTRTEMMLTPHGTPREAAPRSDRHTFSETTTKPRQVKARVTEKVEEGIRECKRVKHGRERVRGKGEK